MKGTEKVNREKKKGKEEGIKEGEEEEQIDQTTGKTG